MLAQGDDNKFLLKISSSPHVKHEDTVTSIMLDVIIALVPALVWSIYVFGFRPLTLTLVSVVSCVLFELIFCLILKKPISIGDLSAVVTGILLAFGLPPASPLWTPIVGAAFAIIIVKMLFGGIGKNVVNPAIAGRVFLFISCAPFVGRYTEPFEKLSPFAMNPPEIITHPDILSSATPLAQLKQGLLPEQTIFDMILGNIAGCIGEISALLLIAGGIYLIFRKVITWHIPVTMIGITALLTYLFSRNLLSANFMLAELFSGGLIIGAIYMATDYSTSPLNNNGKLIYGIGCGAITVFIRYFGSYPEGVSFAILIMNLLVWYIDKLTKPKKFGGTV